MSVRGLFPRVLWAIALILALGADSTLEATNLTGTFKHPDGSPVNGKLVFLLSQPARLADGSAQVVPMVKIFSVTNGELEPGAFVYGNDVLLPSGTYYLVRLVDNSNNLLFEQKWSIQGTDLDLGTLTPTTTGVVLADPLVKNVTTEQAVEGPVTFNSGLTTFSLVLNGNLNPGSASAYDLGSTTLPWNELTVNMLRARQVPWFDVRAYGAKGDNATNDAAAFQAAIDACAAGGAGQAGGTVYVPKASVGNYYRINSPITFTDPAPGSHCRLLLEGSIATNQTLALPDEGWNIEGSCGTNAQEPSFIHQGCNTTIASTGTQNPLLKIGTGYPGGAKRVTIKGINVVGNIVGDAIVIDGGSGVTLDSVFAGVNADAAGHALLVKDFLQVFIRNSVFTSPSDTATIGTYYGIRATGTNTGSNVGSITITDTTFIHRGVKFDRQLAGSAIGNVYMNRVLMEAYQDALMTIDTTNSSFLGGFTCVHCEMADLAFGNAAMVKVVGPSSFDSITFIDSEMPLNGWVDVSGATGPIGAVHVIGDENGVILPGADANRIGSRVAQGGWFARLIGAQSDPGSQATELLGGTLQVNMASPVGVVATPGGGGSLADGTYYYEITALPGIESPCDNTWTSCWRLYETRPSQEVSCTISGGGGAGSCALSWTAVPGAASYRVWGRGQYGLGLHNKTGYLSTATNSVTDTGSALTSGGMQTWNREDGNAPVVRFISRPGKNVHGVPQQHFIGAGNLGIGTYTPGAPLDVVGKIRTTTQLESTVATGTAPLAVASTTRVNNLNAQRWEGKDAVDFSQSLDFGSISAQSCAELTVSVSGATANNPVAPSWPAALEAGLVGVMRVSAADTVSVRLCNVTSSPVDPAAQTFAGRVIR